MKITEKIENGIRYEVHEYSGGSREWYVSGQHHRMNGPAIERADGSRNWYWNGQRHRVDK